MANVTVEEVARHLAALTQTEEDILLIGQWVDARWKELAASNNLRVLLREGELFMPAPFSTGTVSATRGSTTVTGSGTGWTNALAGRHIRIRGVWHEIATVVSPTVLELGAAYGEDTVSGAGYNIIQRRLDLAPDVRKLGVFWHMRLRRPLHTVHKQGLDLVIPSRYSINSVPTWVAEVEASENGVKRVEIYPYPRNSEIIHYTYWRTPFTLGLRDIMPDFIDIEAFREGVMVDILRHKMHKAIEAGQTEVAAFWRNEFRAQETVWKRDHKIRVLGQEQGSDDQEFVLSREGAHPTLGNDRIIDDAFSQVWYGS